MASARALRSAARGLLGGVGVGRGWKEQGGWKDRRGGPLGDSAGQGPGGRPGRRVPTPRTPPTAHVLDDAAAAHAPLRQRLQPAAGGPLGFRNHQRASEYPTAPPPHTDLRHGWGAQLPPGRVPGTAPQAGVSHSCVLPSHSHLWEHERLHSRFRAKETQKTRRSTHPCRGAAAVWGQAGKASASGWHQLTLRPPRTRQPAAGVPPLPRATVSHGSLAAL